MGKKCPNLVNHTDKHPCGTCGWDTARSHKFLRDMFGPVSKSHNNLVDRCTELEQQLAEARAELEQRKVDPLTAALEANRPAYIRRLEQEPGGGGSRSL